MSPETAISLEYKKKAKERVDSLIKAGEWSKLSIKERVDNLIEVANAWRDKYEGVSTLPDWEYVTLILTTADFIKDASVDDPLEDYREGV